MLLTKAVLDDIVAGRVELVYRRWKRPTVKAGGRLRTQVGELSILAVEVITPSEITDDHARRAGATCADDLRADLFRDRPASARGARPDESSLLYQITVAFAGPDSRLELRESAHLDREAAEALLAKLRSIDGRSNRGPWTISTLQLIQQWPARRAPELAELQGLETIPFKASVRRLKELGLTESLAVGYRLSARGTALLAHFQQSLLPQ